MPKGIVTTQEGKTFKLVKREETGLVDCPGDAHSNPFIDNCMICAPNWGKVMSYRPVSITELKKGVAVPVTYTGKVMSGEAKSFEKAAKEIGAQLVMVTEKTRGATTSFYAWILP